MAYRMYELCEEGAEKYLVGLTSDGRLNIECRSDDDDEKDFDILLPANAVSELYEFLRRSA
jgi:hypothetical protein